MKPLTDISVSDIQAFQRCPLRWCFATLDGRVPRRVPTAFRTGSLIHTAFQSYFGIEVAPGGLGDHLRDLLPDTTLLDEYETKAVNECRGLVEPLNFWTDFYPVTETLEVEEAHSWQLDNGLIFHMRPDRVVMVNDYMFHMQHKTMAASRNIATFLDVAARSMHELLYYHGLNQKYPGVKNGGTIYNIVRKLKYKSSAKGKRFGIILHEPHEFFCQQVVPISQNLVDEALYDLNSVSNEMQHVASGYGMGIRPASNHAQDEDMFSKGTDPYFEVLMGRASLDDDLLFMDREDRYSTKEVENVR